MVDYRTRFISTPQNKTGNKKDANISVLLMSANNNKKFRRALACLEFKNHKKLIDYQIKNIREQWPEAEIIIALGYDANTAIKYIQTNYPFVRIVENTQYADTNNVKSLYLSMLVSDYTNDLCIINGDLYFNKKYLSCIDTSTTGVINDKKNNISVDEVGMTIVEGVVTYISHGLGNRWGQIVFVKQKDRSILYTLASDVENHKRHIYEILNMSTDKKMIIRTFDNIGGKVHEFDNLRDIEKFNENLGTI